MKKNAKPYYFEVFQGYRGPTQMTEPPWYWRLTAANGKIIADGSEGYSKKANAKAAVRRLFKGLLDWGVLTWKE
mgnify:CR=1 FL=1